jgi:hypothetical protein
VRLWNLNLRCPGETSDTYLTIAIDQKFIGVVSTETEIWFFEKKVSEISNFKFQNPQKIKFEFEFEIEN